MIRLVMIILASMFLFSGCYDVVHHKSSNISTDISAKPDVNKDVNNNADVYVARAVIDDDNNSSELFDSMIEITDQNIIESLYNIDVSDPAILLIKVFTEPIGSDTSEIIIIKTNDIYDATDILRDHQSNKIEDLKHDLERNSDDIYETKNAIISDHSNFVYYIESENQNEHENIILNAISCNDNF